MVNRITVAKSFPKLNESWLSKFELELKEELGFCSLPEDYKGFLLKSNGGIVYPNDLDTGNTEYEQIVQFNSPLQYKDGSFEKPALIMLYTVWLEEEMRPLEDEIEEWDLYSLKESNIYSREDFDILPDQMMSFGLCNYMGSGDVLAMSLAEEDYGCVYYLNSKVSHPANFFADFFKDRIDAIYAEYGINGDTDLESEAYNEVQNVIKKAHFVKVADSFDSFWNGLEITRYEL